ncbi:hypothetical protein OY671_000353 [Metschnikowia pulcherrima]|nr:hypothetical protein OY671_000353 [Metschnikowia pulcherrima]
MSFADDFKDDFGPVRQASAEDIKKEQQQRSARWKQAKSQGSENETKNNRVDMKPSDSKFPDIKSTEKMKGTPKNEPSIAPRKRKLFLAGKEELVKYLEEKKRRKLEKKKMETNKGPVTKPVRRKLMFKPVDEAYRQKVLAELEAKEKKQSEKTSDTPTAPSEQVMKLESDAHLEVVSISSDSDLEFEDASPTFHGQTILEPCAPTHLASDAKSQGELSNGNSPEIEVIDDFTGPNHEDIDSGKESDNSRQGLTSKSINTAKNDLVAGANEVEALDANSLPSEADVKTMKKLILSQVNGNTPLRIKESTLYAPYKEVYSMFSHTIHDSESHTAILTGAAGSGKTEIVEQALGELQASNAEKFLTIRLSGSLHFTDQHAIREIARQLDVKLRDFTEDLGGDTYEQRAINETFQNILSTLFRIEDPADPVDKKESPIRVIFVIDEIERFVTNPKQTLLYNLFELAQASKVPVCILGITPRVSLRELFEKRVKSRFSSRTIYTKKADNVELFWENAKLWLTVPASKFSEFSDKNYPEQWNETIEHLFRSGSGLTKTIYKTYHTTKNYRQVNNECALPISKINKNHPFPESADFEAYQKLAVCGIEAVIASLSPAELLVVVAAARWIAKTDPPHVNFKLAYNEYMDMMKAVNTESTTLSSKTSYIDNMSLMGIKVTRTIYPAKVLQGCWRVVYRTGLLFDAISTSNEVNARNSGNIFKDAMIDDSKWLQLDVTLEELAKLIPGDNFVRRFTRL